MRVRSQLNTTLAVVWPLLSVVCVTLTVWFTWRVCSLAKAQRAKRLYRRTLSVTQSPTVSSDGKSRFTTNIGLNKVFQITIGLSTGTIASVVCALVLCLSQLLRLLTAVMITIRIFGSDDSAKDSITSELPLSGPNRGIYVLCLFFQNCGYFTFVFVMGERLQSTFRSSVWKLDERIVRAGRFAMGISGLVICCSVAFVSFDQSLATQMAVPVIAAYPFFCGYIIWKFQNNTWKLSKEMLSMGDPNQTDPPSMNQFSKDAQSTQVLGKVDSSHAELTSVSIPAPLKTGGVSNYSNSQISRNDIEVKSEEESPVISVESTVSPANTEDATPDMDGATDSIIPVDQIPALDPNGTIHSNSEMDTQPQQKDQHAGTDLGLSPVNSENVSRNRSLSIESVTSQTTRHHSRTSIMRIEKAVTLLHTSLRLSICCTSAILSTFLTLTSVVTDRQLVTVSPLSFVNVLLFSWDPIITLYCLMSTFSDQKYYRWVFGRLHDYCFKHLRL